MTDSTRREYRQHLLVETPEHVQLDYELAGIGSRALALLIDLLIIATSLLLISFLAAWLSLPPRLMGGMIAALSLLLLPGYFAGFESLRDGRTPGKRMMGIRTIRDTGHGLTPGAAFLRSLLLLVDLPTGIGAVLIMAHPHARRLGDIVAGTVVVREQPVVGIIQASATSSMDGPREPSPPQLDDESFQILRSFQQRAAELPEAARARMAALLVKRLADHLNPTLHDDLSMLEQLYQVELASRQGRFASQRRKGIGSPVEKLVARKGQRWEEFRILAERVSRQGLDHLSAAELPDFAARYREVAADLARVRTYQADPGVILRVERLVAAGHNALYRSDRRTPASLLTYLLVSAPAEVVHCWKKIFLSFLVFAIPATAGYATLRAQPGLYEALIPDGMIERAEAGARRTHEGERYLTVASEDRPGLALRIMANNIRVSLTTFAGGIFLGIGALFMVAYNGVILGMISGYFANLGLLGYLWTFVAGHGVLELFAIWVAGAAGLDLGLSFINPGRFNRSDAMAMAGRRAVRLLVAVIFLLIIAGSIEGMISAGSYSLHTRLTVTALSTLFLIVYLVSGAILAKKPANSAVAAH